MTVQFGRTTLQQVTGALPSPMYLYLSCMCKFFSKIPSHHFRVSHRSLFVCLFLLGKASYAEGLGLECEWNKN